MDALRISLLGPFDLRDTCGRRVVVQTRKTLGLLAYLARHPGERHARESLASMLWTDSDQAHARGSLRQALSSLAHCLGEARAALLVDSECASLDGALIEVDVLRLETGLGSGSAQERESALALYRGPFLEGLVTNSGFDRWVASQREYLESEALQGLYKVLAAQEGEQRIDMALHTAMRIISLESTSEEAHRALMRLFLRQGRLAAALRQFQMCADVLRTELGVAPSRETLNLRDSLLPRR
jgi:DNA-binding SARP family transcriptional activator